jgi:hypothetical protein
LGGPTLSADAADIRDEVTGDAAATAIELELRRCFSRRILDYNRNLARKALRKAASRLGFHPLRQPT